MLGLCRYVDRWPKFHLLALCSLARLAEHNCRGLSETGSRDSPGKARRKGGRPKKMSGAESKNLTDMSVLPSVTSLIKTEVGQLAFRWLCRNWGYHGL
jgi:hypothetical protein